MRVLVSCHLSTTDEPISKYLKSNVNTVMNYFVFLSSSCCSWQQAAAQLGCFSAKLVILGRWFDAHIRHSDVSLEKTCR